MRRPLTTTRARDLLRVLLALIGAPALVPNTACDALVHHDCPTPGVTNCDTEHPGMYYICETNEDGSTSSYPRSCGPGKGCDVKTGLCTAKQVGESCAMDNNCADNLRCESSVCVAPADEDIAACQNAPIHDVPAQGGIDVEMSFHEDLVSLAERIIRTDCEIFDAGGPALGSVGLVRLRLPEKGATLLADYSTTRSSVSAIGGVDCDYIYRTGAFFEQCAKGYAGSTAFIHTDVATEIDLLVALPINDKTPNIKIRLSILR